MVLRSLARSLPFQAVCMGYYEALEVEFEV